MKTVAIADLKARLSRHLRDVRLGGGLVVTDRGRPIARISPMGAERGGPLQELIRAGLATPGRGPLPVSLCRPPKTAADPRGATLKALFEERRLGR